MGRVLSLLLVVAVVAGCWLCKSPLAAPEPCECKTDSLGEYDCLCPE